MTTTRIVETVLVMALFLAQVVLWRIKQVREIRATGVDPQVLSRAETPVQGYFAKLVPCSYLDDRNPDTRDFCMPMGCVHMPGHMGMGGHPMV